MFHKFSCRSGQTYLFVTTTALLMYERAIMDQCCIDWSLVGTVRRGEVVLSRRCWQAQRILILQCLVVALFTCHVSQLLIGQLICCGSTRRCSQRDGIHYALTLVASEVLA
jgi:hypothetical protein